MIFLTQRRQSLLRNSLYSKIFTSDREIAAWGRKDVGVDMELGFAHGGSDSRVSKYRSRERHLAVLALGRELARVASAGRKTTRKERTLQARPGRTGTSGPSQRGKVDQGV